MQRRMTSTSGGTRLTWWRPNAKSCRKRYRPSRQWNRTDTLKHCAPWFPRRDSTWTPRTGRTISSKLWRFRCKHPTHHITRTARPTNGLFETFSTALTSLSDVKLLLIHLCLIFTTSTKQDSESNKKPVRGRPLNRSLLLQLRQQNSKTFFHSYLVKEICLRKTREKRIFSRCGNLLFVRDSKFAPPYFSYAWLRSHFSSPL